MTQTVTDIHDSWKANLELVFSPRPTKSVLTRRKQFGPLTVQKPFYPEGDLCHLYLLHPPGGVVGGDALLINCQMEAGASALLTTPGAGKFYRSGGARAHQIQTFSVESGASLEWLPQENIFFPGADCHLETKIELQAEAKFIGWEIHCLGRPANAESFSFGQMLSSIQIYRSGQPFLLERFKVSGEHDLSNSTGLRSYPVSANLYATGMNEEALNQIQQRFSELENAAVGHTLLDDLLISRYIGHSTEQAKHLFIDIWSFIRPTVNKRAATLPRIWST